MDSFAGNRLTFQETDEAESATTTFIYSEQDNGASKQPRGRVDVMVSRHSLDLIPRTLSLAIVHV